MKGEKCVFVDVRFCEDMIEKLRMRFDEISKTARQCEALSVFGKGLDTKRLKGDFERELAQLNDFSNTNGQPSIKETYSDAAPEVSQNFRAFYDMAATLCEQMEAVTMPEERYPGDRRLPVIQREPSHGDIKLPQLPSNAITR